MSRTRRFDRGAVVFCAGALGFWLSGLAASLAAQAPTDPGTYSLPFFPSAADSSRQGFARVINRSGENGTVRIDVFDDAGRTYGPLLLSIDPGETVHFNSRDLENGNPAIGLAGSTGSGEGPWRLVLRSALDFEALGYVRTTAGFLTSMQDVAADVNGRHQVPTFNPGNNANAAGLLRLVNPGDETAEVTITGVDDRGLSPGGAVTLAIPPRAARSYLSRQLETGNAAGLKGALGDGKGKWQLVVTSGQPITVMSLISGKTGYLTNLSTAPWALPRAPRQPDLTVATPRVSDRNPAPGTKFTLSVTVENAGERGSAETALRFYRSLDSLISPPDAQLATGAVSALPPLGTSTLSIETRAPATASTYYLGACVDAVTDESDRSNNCSPPIRVNVDGTPRFPDLEVRTFTVSDPSPGQGEAFRLHAEVANAGNGPSEVTVLRYYQSATASISNSDTQVGTGSVDALPPSATGANSIALTATDAGATYYGACVDPVPNESDTQDNCSRAVRVDVRAVLEHPNLQVDSPGVSDATPRVDTPLTFSATVHNRGGEVAEPTTLRVYRSRNASIERTDTQVGTSDVGSITAGGRSAHSVALRTPTAAGRYYYGACVDAVDREVATTDNCSRAVRVDVEPTPTGSSGFDIDLVFTHPQPSAAARGAFTEAAAIWEGVISGDLRDVDFVNHPQNNTCTDVVFNGLVDDVRIYIHVVQIDGPGGIGASAGTCISRTPSDTPVIALIEIDSADLPGLAAATISRMAVHEIAHVLGFGFRWNVVNPSVVNGRRVVPPPDTHWPGPRAIAAFNAAGGSSYPGGKVPVENERGGVGSQDFHWRQSAMPDEIMTYDLSGSVLSAVTIQSIGDLGYGLNASSAASSVVLPSSARVGETALRCGIGLRNLQQTEVVED